MVSNFIYRTCLKQSARKITLKLLKSFKKNVQRWFSSCWTILQTPWQQEIVCSPLCDSLWTSFVMARFYELNVNRSENTIVGELTTVPQDIRGSQQYHKESQKTHPWELNTTAHEHNIKMNLRLTKMCWVREEGAGGKSGLDSGLDWFF